MSKVITKMVHERLDSFISDNSNKEQEQEQSTGKTFSEVKQNKKTIKKASDGLMEKMDPKIIISEDNRQFLRD